jgi:hypothetical protein
MKESDDEYVSASGLMKSITSALDPSKQAHFSLRQSITLTEAIKPLVKAVEGIDARLAAIEPGTRRHQDRVGDPPNRREDKGPQLG